MRYIIWLVEDGGRAIAEFGDIRDAQWFMNYYKESFATNLKVFVRDI